MSKRNIENHVLNAYGKGARWIGWDHWIKHQPFFKAAEKKIEESVAVGNRKSIYVYAISESNWSTPAITLYLDGNTGELECVKILSVDDVYTVLNIYRDSTVLIKRNEAQVVFEDLFQNPTHPTDEELDLFTALYGDDDILLDLNPMFFQRVQHLNKAAVKNAMKFIVDEDIPF
ncbi:hypothetical protein [Escherichia phage vB_EcoM-LTH01]